MEFNQLSHGGPSHLLRNLPSKRVWEETCERIRHEPWIWNGNRRNKRKFQPGNGDLNQQKYGTLTRNNGNLTIWIHIYMGSVGMLWKFMFGFWMILWKSIGFRWLLAYSQSQNCWISGCTMLHRWMGPKTTNCSLFGASDFLGNG